MLNTRTGWIVVALFHFAVLAYLGSRAVICSQVILHPAPAMAATMIHQAEPFPDLLKSDKSLAAELNANARDPFRWPPADESSQSVSHPKDDIVLVALLIDRVTSMARITVNREQSSWLVVGDEFRHWRVTAMSESTATVARGNVTQTLAVRR